MIPDQENDSSDAREPWEKWKRHDARQRVKALVRQMEDAEAERQRQTQEEVNRRERIRRRRANEAFDPPLDDASLSRRLHLPYSRIEEPRAQTMAIDVDDEDVVEDEFPTQISNAEVAGEYRGRRDRGSGELPASDPVPEGSPGTPDGT